MAEDIAPGSAIYHIGLIRRGGRPMSERFVEQHAEGQTPAYSMTHEQLSRELSYRAALSIAARLGKSGVLSASELKHTEQ